MRGAAPTILKGLVMVRIFGRVTFALVVLASISARADKYEMVSYTPPPGWQLQVAQDGRAYLRQDAEVGSITLYAARPVTAAAKEVFLEDWRNKVQAAITVATPKPEVVTSGDVTRVSAVRQATANGRNFTIVLVTFVVRGQAVSVTGAASGDEANRQLAAFFDGMTAGDAPAPAPAPAAAAGTIEVEFDVPDAYTPGRQGPMVVLTPRNADTRTPCTYGVAPARASLGSLEADAQAALVETFAGWQKKNADETRNSAMRGTAAAGWPYYWYRADLQRLVNGSYEYATGMVTVFPAGTGRVNVVWGFGNLAHCTHNDASFAHIFHSLKPKGWSSDGGQALARDLVGTWRLRQTQGMIEYKFGADGSFEEGRGTSTTTGVSETTKSRAVVGRYALKGSRITLTGGDGKSLTYLVRVYDEWVMGKWTRAMSLLNDGAIPPYEAQFFRIDQAP